MKLQAIWSFIAGDSRRVPLGVALAVLVALALERWTPGFGAWIGVVFVAVIAAGLIAGVFEETS